MHSGAFPPTVDIGRRRPELHPYWWFVILTRVRICLFGYGTSTGVRSVRFPPPSRLIPAGFGRSVETFREQSRSAVDGAPELACAAERLVTAFGLVPRPGLGTASERLGVVAADTAVTGLLEGAVRRRCAPSGQEAGGLDVRDGAGPVRWSRLCLGSGAQRGSSGAGGLSHGVLGGWYGRWPAAHFG